MEGLDCHRCSSQMKKIRGCTEEVHPYTIAEYVVNKCPLRYATYADVTALQVYKEYNAGFLPNDGGWLDQPMKLSMIVQLVDSIVQRLDQRRQDAKPGN